MEILWQLFDNSNQTATREHSGIAEDILSANQDVSFVTFLLSLIAIGGMVKLSSKVKNSFKTNKSDLSSKPCESVIPELQSHPLIGPLYPLLRNGMQYMYSFKKFEFVNSNKK